MGDLDKTTYRILLEGGEGEIEEKKSRFIATVQSVASEEEANAFIAQMKKKYWDARHNCSAFILGSDAQLTRCSDDGEPAGTAGRPMLEVLLGSGIRNVAVVVTRYFGGTLLGTGGLVRAYSQAVKAGLEACKTGSMIYGKALTLTTDYNDIGKVLYILGQRAIPVENAIYEADVKVDLHVANGESESLIKEFTEATCGRIVIAESEPDYFLQL